MSIRNRVRPIAYESLPEGYTRCEYLESTGTQWIDTLYYPCWDSVISTEGCFLNSNANYALYATVEDKSESHWDSAYFVSLYVNRNRGWVSHGKQSGISEITNLFKFGIKQVFNASKDGIFIDGLKIDNAFEPSVYRNVHSLYLFARNYLGDAELPAVARIWSFKVSEKGVIKREFIPALDPTGKPCMFDLVSCTPFYNQSTTGPDFLYRAYSYPFNPGNNWHTFKHKLTDIIRDTKYVTELVTENESDKFVLHTDRINDTQLEAVTALLERVVQQNVEVAQYNHHIELSWRVADKYANCTTVNAIKAVNPDYKSDLTADMAWLYPLPMLKDGHAMFDRTNLAAWYAELPMLEKGQDMFQYTQLTEWHIKLPKLWYAWWMFAGTKITEWNIALPALRDGTNMFYQSKLTKWNAELPALRDGTNMFAETGLTEWDIELPSLTVGSDMFRQTKISEWNIELPALNAGNNMFKGTLLKEWHIQLPALTNGRDMFAGTKISEWNIKLPALTNGHGMFYRTQLTEWHIELSKMTIAEAMFYGTKLTEWNIELPELTTAPDMFNSVPLLSFTVGLPKLTSAARFLNGAKIDKASVLTICDSIPAYASGSHPLTLGIHVDHKYDVDVNLALKKADINYEPTIELPEEVTEGKGWTIVVQWNGTPTT